MAQSFQAPIIIYGSVRSGTTMFRLMLSAHPDLVEIGENQYMIDGLKDPEAAQLFYDTHWLEHERVFRMRGLTCAPDLDGEAMLEDFLTQLREGREGPLVITFHADIAVLERLFPDARYIHIYRDPRDVANSATRFGWSGNVYYGSDFWLDAEASWADIEPELDPSRYTQLRYEDLVMNARGELARICEFLELEFTDEMFGYAKTSTYDTPDPNLTFQWKRKLTPQQTALVERRCGPLMDKLGYERAHPDVKPFGPLGRAYWAAHNKIGKVSAAISFYGLRDYALEKLYRLPGFQTRHQAVLLSMQDTMNRSLK
ncbi:MAG: sulfotransferase [Pseudomonadota bacterium]